MFRRGSGQEWRRWEPALLAGTLHHLRLHVVDHVAVLLGLLIPFGARVADPVPTQPAAGHLFSLADHLVRIGLRLRFGGSVVLVGGGTGGRGGGGRRSDGFGGRGGGKRDRSREGH